MKIKVVLVLVVLHCFAAAVLAQTSEPPREWIDPDTGHRVIRLSNEPGSTSLYFHQNPYTPDGQKLIITTPNGLAAINLKTRAMEKIVDGRVGVIIVGRKSGDVYYTRTVMNNSARTTTVCDALPLITKPPIITSLPVRTCPRVEMFASGTSMWSASKISTIATPVPPPAPETMAV